MKVLVYPPNSLILADLVERGGHEPVVLMREVGEHVRDAEIDAPPMNITDEDLKRALRYVSVEEPAGLKGRVGLLTPMLEKAEAAIILADAPPTFGCMGCAVADEFFKFLIRKQGIPTLEVKYKEGEQMEPVVSAIMDFLERLSKEEKKEEKEA
ncbi:MAG TPA: methanogenesis marker 5 protein [Candidatus Bathyarchaeia archaeon]|nr:methanogenesis marker 5 protein [Candidatus Bathyarchaeia archaeon]